MFKTRPGPWLLAASVILLLVSTQAVMAQCGGTLNLRSGVAYKGANVGWTDWRFWDGEDNKTYAFGLTGKVADNWDGSVTFQAAGTEGEDPIGGAVRKSDLQLLALDAGWQVRDTNWKIVLNPGCEFVTADALGTNAVTGESADWGDMIGTFGVVCERQYGSWTWIINPKLAGWKDDVVATNYQTVEGFGTVIGIGVGLRKQMDDRLVLMADVTPIISGDNSLDMDTNEVERTLVWGVGATYLLLPDSNTWLTVFGSNAFGTTPATSLLATPDNSVCFGVRAASTF
ncbi:hypothetical protein LLH23_00665 [bacterium]|nr:hypothetical protein [bacterium]